MNYICTVCISTPKAPGSGIGMGIMICIYLGKYMFLPKVDVCYIELVMLRCCT